MIIVFGVEIGVRLVMETTIRSFGGLGRHREFGRHCSWLQSLPQ